MSLGPFMYGRGYGAFPVSQKRYTYSVFGPYGTNLEMWCRVTGCGFESRALRFALCDARLQWPTTWDRQPAHCLSHC